jgi:hypothetical protein
MVLDSPIALRQPPSAPVGSQIFSASRSGGRRLFAGEGLFTSDASCVSQASQILELFNTHFIILGIWTKPSVYTGDSSDGCLE